MSLRRPLPALALAVVVAVPAALIGAAVPHVFANSSVADATAVNANFTALASAVTTLESQMAATQGRVTTLEEKTPVTVHQVLPTANFTLSASNVLADMPGMQKTVTLARTSTVLAFYSFSGPVDGHIVTRMKRNGTVLESTESVIGNVNYGTASGQWMGELGPGSYDFRVEYRAITADAQNNALDYIQRSMHIVVIGG